MSLGQDVWDAAGGESALGAIRLRGCYPILASIQTRRTRELLAARDYHQLMANPRYKPSVDPFLDTDVIDARAPRVNQAVVSLVTLAAFLLDFWPLATLMGLQLAIGLTFGRQYCLPCLFYFKVLQPRYGEGRIEDSRPPRFANVAGIVFLTVATVAFLAGLTTLGWVLTLIVSALAGFAAVSGICVGCEMYALYARARGIRLIAAH